MPATSAMFGRLTSAAKWYSKAGIWRTTRAAARVQARGQRLPRAALMGAGAAFDVTALLSRSIFRMGMSGVNFAGKHPVIATTAGIGAMGSVGVLRGMYAAGRGMSPIPQRNKPMPVGQGPGYDVWGSPSRGPLQPNNLGATGDLTLALSRTRHG